MSKSGIYPVLCERCLKDICICHLNEACNDPDISRNTRVVNDYYSMFMQAGIMGFYSRYSSKDVEYGAVLRRDDRGRLVMTDPITDNRPHGVRLTILVGDMSTVHNHTNNMPPSLVDVKALGASNSSMKTLYICTSNGMIYALYRDDDAMARTFSHSNPSEEEFRRELETTAEELRVQSNNRLSQDELYMHATAYLLLKKRTGLKLMKLDRGYTEKFIQVDTKKDGNGIYRMKQCK